jgi:hypothetical protein
MAGIGAVVNHCGSWLWIEVLVNDGRLEKVRGDRSSPKSYGYLCNKATRIRCASDASGWHGGRGAKGVSVYAGSR